MLALKRVANQRHWSFRSVGVALDWSASDGADYLNKMAHFDEIAAGYNWGNAQALRSIWDVPTGEPSTPQVVLYTRLHVRRPRPMVVLLERRHELPVVPGRVPHLVQHGELRERSADVRGHALRGVRPDLSSRG